MSSSHVGAPRPPTPALTATTAFVRFARHLRGTHPMVPISAALNDQINGFVDHVRLGQPTDEDVGWESVVCSMAEASISLAAGEHCLPYCGLSMLRAYGQLSEVLHETQSVRLPAPIAITLLMEYQPLPFLLEWTDRNTRIVTTKIGTAKLGGPASFAVPAAPRNAWGKDFAFWHLSRLPGSYGPVEID